MDSSVIKLPIYDETRTSVIYEVSLIIDSKFLDYVNSLKLEVQYMNKTWRVFSRFNRSRSLSYIYNILWDKEHGNKGDLILDHINHNSLDCRLENLRLVTKTQNQYNRRSTINSASKYKGVSWDKARNLWRAQIKRNGKTKNLGLYSLELDAKIAYDKALEIVLKELENG